MSGPFLWQISEPFWSALVDRDRQSADCYHDAAARGDGWSLRALQRYQHSRLDIRLVDNMVDPIKDGFDVVFGTGPLQDSTLIARKLFSLALFLCASPDFVGQLAEPLVDPKQLETCPASTSASAGHTSSRWPNATGDMSCRLRCGDAPTTFRCASNTFCKGSASVPCPRRSSVLTNSAKAASCLCCRNGYLISWTCT